MRLVSRYKVAEVGLTRQHAAVVAAGWLCLGSLLLWIFLRIYPALLLPWWFNTDEVVIYYEVIRQLRLDASQTFFDIPGTPYISITSGATAVWWAAEKALGMTGSGSPGDFAFANAQGVFTLMRALTMAMYFAAVALAFDTFRRTAGALTAIVAAVLLASLPIHVQYSYFVRTESLGLVLCLSAIWIVLYSRRRGTALAYGLAGILAGAAVGARYHFALVGLPVIIAVYFLREREQLPAKCGSAYHFLYAAGGVLAALFIGGAIVAMLHRADLIYRCWLTDTMMLTTAAGPGQYANAKRAVAGLWQMGGIGSLAMLLCYRFPRTRRFFLSLVNPFTLSLVLGFVGGFLLSHPEFLWRGEYQLKSIQFYADWTDPQLASMAPLSSWWNVSKYYFAAALPERWLQVAFLAGTAIILWRRQATHMAFLGGAALCFVAHPLTMKLWPHHIIPWLPLLCFVAAVPAGLLGDCLTRRYPRAPVAVALVVLSATILAWPSTARLRRAGEYLTISRLRTLQISEMNNWLSKHVPADTYLLVSYFALNEDGFLEWINEAGVSVPDFVKKHRNVAIWWLDRASVNGRAGIVCVSRADIEFFRSDFERRDPGSTYNPFEDSAFEALASFGGGFYELQVFRFDFRHRGT